MSKSKPPEALQINEFEELLQKERRSTDFFASRAEIDDETPMLIEGLIRKSGVSVFYGAFDEFKTTLLLDMMAHVAAGATWRGRKVTPCPVIWYALEGKEEIPVRLRALEANLVNGNTLWGNDHLPIITRDRIPETYLEWRTEIGGLNNRNINYMNARHKVGDLKFDTSYDNSDDRLPFYPIASARSPVIVIDTLSLALGGEDEKGPRAVGLISDCLDLLKFRQDMGNPYDGIKHADQYDKWEEKNPEGDRSVDPVASHVIIIHHQTKTGIDFAGHRAIGGNTSGLFRVHRFGKMTDDNRSYSGQLTPLRVKGIPRPAPIRFDVDVVPVEGTKQTAAILKDKAKAIPRKLKPIIEALRELEDHEEISKVDLNDYLDVVSKGTDNAKRGARKRNLESLITAGVLEPVEDDNGKVKFYRFHDTGAV